MSRSDRSIGVIVAAAAGVAAGSAAPRVVMAGVATIISSKDNTLYESATGANSNGAGGGFFAGRTAQFSNNLRRGLVAFDLQAGFPTNATPTSVSVQLTSTRGLNSSAVSLHVTQQDWGEGASDAGDSNDGGGTTAAAGDATWIHTFHDNAFWTNTGGDFDPTFSGSTTVGIGVATFAPTPRLLADVQGWLANPTANFGWTVVGGAAAGSAKRFASRENPDPSARPRLIVEYDAPAWQTAGGLWSAPANWGGGVPGAVGHAAEFTYATGGPGSTIPVTLDTPRTLAVLHFDSPNAYVLTGAPLTINGPAGLNAINVVSGSHQIAAPLVLAAGVKLSIASGASLKLAGDVSGSGKVTALDVAGGRLDLADNRLITTVAAGSWNGSAYTDVAGLVDSGRGDASNAQWNSLGIVTSDTRAVNNNDLVSIGAASVANVKAIAATATATFAGQTVLGSDTIAMVTWGGDANLDGKVNILDYGQIDFNVGSSGSVFGWFNGDFNYDGKINILDYGIIDFNVGAQDGSFASSPISAMPRAVHPADGADAVPEPATLAGIAWLMLSLQRQRRSPRTL